MLVASPAVAQPWAVIAEVLQQAQGAGFRIGGVAGSGQPSQGSKEFFHLTFPQLIQAFLPPSLGRRPTPDGRRRGVQVLGGMVAVTTR